MSTQIEREFVFQAGAYFEGKFMMNVYDISLSMLVETDSIREQNIAMDRIKYFLSECLESSVFVEESEKKAIEKFQAAGIKVCALPEEPYDQIVTLILLMKLNAITEGRLLVTDIVLVSELSDGVKFIYDIESVMEGNPFTKGWWLEANTHIANVEKTAKKEKVVKLIKTVNEWAALDLDWKEKNSSSTEIIFSTDDK
jgi:hypothetical protein